MDHSRWCSSIAVIVLLGIGSVAQAQWEMQRSGTRASLRGIQAVDGTVAWASGTDGTVLRTADGGQHWTICSIPQGAAKLDFRSVWAWDAENAMAMSSGPGQLSRLYSTHDGCRSWRLLFSNPDADDFWDGLQFDGKRFGVILGDPVNGSFTLFATRDGGGQWTRQTDPCLRTMEPNQGAFAASNQALAVFPIESAETQPGFALNHQVWFGTNGGWLYGLQLRTLRLIADSRDGCVHRRVLSDLHGPAAGVFAVAFSDSTDGVAVGGDYSKPQQSSNSAAYTTDGLTWQSAVQPPSGYRSTIAWNGGEGTWIAAGPNGSDVSRDGGKTWEPLDRGNWNAISLPFAVGPDGRIARLVSWGQLRVSNTAPFGNLPSRTKD